jgi:YggT family protein
MRAILFILHSLLTLIVIAFLLRLVIPLGRGSLRNTLGQAVMRVTDPIVLPLRKLFKPIGRFDVAALLALLLVQFAGTALLQLVAGMGFQPLAILVAGLRDLAETTIQFYTVAILVYAVLSWVAPGARSPAMDLLSRLCEPLLAPVRRLLPSLGGLDLSPLIILIGLQALLILLR